MRIPQQWSATPTPFHADLSLDLESVDRLVARHVAFGFHGIMLAGTCGEGPWMPHSELPTLVRRAKEAAGGALRIAVQVTDNSSKRMLELIDAVAAAEADYAVVATPPFMMNATDRRVFEVCRDTIARSPLPIGFYDRGAHAAHSFSPDLLTALLEEPNLHWVKDSSGDPEREARLLAAAAKRPGLTLFTGDEFRCDHYLAAGYHGTLLGGAIFNAGALRAIVAAHQKGDTVGAQLAQARMNELMYRVYGGPGITCWLTGLKHLLVRLGLFSTTAGYLGYPLTPECEAAIDEIIDGPDRDGYRCLLSP